MEPLLFGIVPVGLAVVLALVSRRSRETRWCVYACLLLFAMSPAFWGYRTAANIGIVRWVEPFLLIVLPVTLEIVASTMCTRRAHALWIVFVGPIVYWIGLFLGITLAGNLREAVGVPI